MTRRYLVAGATLAVTVLGVGPQAALAKHYRPNDPFQRSTKQQQSDWRPCADFRGMNCKKFQVPLKAEDPNGSKISLRLARDAQISPTKPWLLYLSGGPGGPGVVEFNESYDHKFLARLRTHFNLAVYDQRGTGQSSFLRCRALNEGESDQAVQACYKELAGVRDYYGTVASVGDIESVRQQLAADKLTLYGSSYGTDLALIYAQAHPDHVAHLVLAGVLNPYNTEPFGLSMLHGIRDSIVGLCPDKCVGISKDPYGDLVRLSQELKKKPLTGVSGNGHGRKVKWTLTPADLWGVINAGSADLSLRAALPSAVRDALHGNPLPLEKLSEAASSLTNEVDGVAVDKAAETGTQVGETDESDARYLVGCSEVAVAWNPASPLSAHAKQFDAAARNLGDAAFAPFSSSIAHELGGDGCMQWPGAGTKPLKPAPFAQVPTFITQSIDDLRTPPEDSLAVANRIAGSKRVVLGGVGHTEGLESSDCVWNQFENFLAGREVKTECERIEVEPVKLRVKKRRW